MTRLPHGSYIIHDDKLCRVWRKPDGSCVAQGKRLSIADKIACPLSLSERRMYVKELARSATVCRNLMQTRKCTLAEAWSTVKTARGTRVIGDGAGYRPVLRGEYSR